MGTLVTPHCSDKDFGKKIVEAGDSDIENPVTGWDAIYLIGILVIR